MGAYVDVPASLLVFARDHGLRSLGPTRRSPVAFGLNNLLALLQDSQ